jgi:hypothetical protein
MANFFWISYEKSIKLCDELELRDILKSLLDCVRAPGGMARKDPGSF